MMNTQAMEQLMCQYLDEHELHSDMFKEHGLSFVFVLYGKNILKAVQCARVELDTLGAFELVKLVNAVGDNLCNMFYDGLDAPRDGKDEEEMDARIYQEGYNEGFGDAKNEMLKFVNYLEPENLS